MGRLGLWHGILELLGDSQGIRTQNLILLVSAIVAIWTIRFSARQDRRRATIDIVVEQKNNVEWQEARRIVHKLREEHTLNLTRYFQEQDSPEYRAIRLTLNTYEFVASGIRASALDEVMYKRLRYSTVMKDWAALKGTVYEFRRARESETLFQDFEWLAVRWSRRPLKRDSSA